MVIYEYSHKRIYMRLKLLRQILKACGDDTRLRILNLLSRKNLTVNQICQVITVSQPTVSKHLAKLRLLRVVVDRREGNVVYYGLNTNKELAQNKIISFINSKFSDVDVFIKDKEALKKIMRKLSCQ